MDRSYFRKFTLLEKTSAGDIDGASGSFVTEIRNGKGTFTISLQGISNFSETTLFLISCDEQKSIGVPIKYDQIQKGHSLRQKLSFDVDNVLNSGLKIEDFSLVALVFKKSVYSGVTPILTGYFEGKVEWRSNFVSLEMLSFSENKKTAEPVAFTDIKSDEKLDFVSEFLFLDKNNNVQEEAVDTEKTLYAASQTSVIADQPEMDFYTYQCGSFEHITKNFKKHLEELENQGIISSDEIAEIENANEDTKKEVNKASDEIDMISFEYKCQSTEIDDLFGQAEKIMPFNTNFHIDWIKVRPSYLALVPNINCGFIFSVDTSLGQKQYGHIILGRTKEDDIYVYYIGIPTKYSKTKARNTNLYFGAYENQPIKEGCFGYWIYKV